MRYGYDVDEIIDYFSLRGKYNSRPFVNDSGEVVACCPFQHVKNGRLRYEKNPSFALNIRTGKWNCYSCKRKGSSPSDLAWELYGDAGVDFRKTSSVKDSIKYVNEEAIFYDIATKAYFDFVTSNREKAVELLLSRGIDLRKRKDVLVGYNNDIVYFPFMFEEKFIGWAERHLSGSKRWLHRISYRYSKSHILYGLDYCKERYCYLTESITDSVKILSLGLPSVSTIQASVSPKQIDLLVDYFDEIVLVEQNDEASISWGVLLNQRIFGVKKFCVSLPKNVKDIADLSNSDAMDVLSDKKVWR